MAMYFSDVETLGALMRMKEAAFVYGTRHFEESGSDDAILKAFVENLKEKEFKRLKWSKTSPQIKYRKSLVEYIMKICEEECLSFQTTYLAIYLLDRFMANHKILLTQLPVVGIVCVVVCGKILETNHEIPRYRSLCGYLSDTPKSTLIKMFTTIENHLLKSFDYSIMVPTEANYLEVYLLYAVDGMRVIVNLDPNNNQSDQANGNLHEMDCNGNQIVIENENGEIHEIPKLYSEDRLPHKEMLDSIRETTLQILQEVTLVSITSVCYAPSLTAAAMLMAARREHGLNFWTSNLQNLTNHTVDEVRQCLNYLQYFLKGLQLKQPFEDPNYLIVIDEPTTYVFDNTEEEEQIEETS